MRAVLERDFVSTASKGRAFVFRSLVAAVVASTIWAVIVENRLLLVDKPDEAARYIFAGGACALLALLFLLTPPSVVGSILEERERDTLPLVLASPVGPRSLAAAKLVARSMAVLTWALAALFPLAAVTLLGGVALAQIADMAMLAVGMVLELAAWGIWLSSVTGRLATGAILAYLLPVVRWALTLSLLGLFAMNNAPWEEQLPEPSHRAALWMAGATTPGPGMVRMIEPRQYERFVGESIAGYFVNPSGYMVPRGSTPPPGVLLHPSALYLVSSLLMALLAIQLAGRRLATEAEPRTGLFAGVLDRKRAGRSPPDGGNPVAWKEQRLLNTAASRPLYYSVIALLTGAEVFYLVSCSTFLRHEREFIEMGMGLAAAHSSLVGLVAVVAGAAAMAHERSVGALDLLRASPLTATDIVRGKLGGLLRGLGLLFLIPLAHLGILAAAGFMDPVTALAAAILDGTFLLFFSMVGMIAGLSALRMGTAVTRGALVYGVFLVGIPLVALLMAIGFGQKDGSEALVTGCPPATSYFVMEGSMRLLHEPWIQAHWFDHPRQLKREHLAALTWAAAYGAAALLAWFLAPRLLARGFDRERGEG